MLYSFVIFELLLIFLLSSLYFDLLIVFLMSLFYLYSKFGVFLYI